MHAIVEKLKDSNKKINYKDIKKLTDKIKDNKLTSIKDKANDNVSDTLLIFS